MKRAVAGEWRRGYRRGGGRSFRSRWVWGVTTLVVLTSASMGVVWQKVRYEGEAMKHEDLKQAHDQLRSNIEAETFEFTKRATRANLLPRALDLGFVDIPTEGIILVSFNDLQGHPDNPLLGGLVGEAMASNRSEAGRRQNTLQPGERDGR